MKKLITFVDSGQDFLEWIVEYPDDGKESVGEVVECGPFQHEVWKGTKVMTSDIKPGDFLPIVVNLSQKDIPVSLKHPVESVEDIG